MRVLLDECLPRRLKQDLLGHEVLTVPEAGWAGKENGELLALATGRFDVLITVDQKLRFQQNLSEMKLGVIVLRAPNNRLDTLRPLVPKILKAIDVARPGEPQVIRA